MGADDLFSVIYTLGAREAGSVGAWEKSLNDWADQVEEFEKQAEFMARRHDPRWMPSAEEMPSQAQLMQMGGPAPLRDG